MPDTLTAPPPEKATPPPTPVQPELTESNATGSADEIKKSFDELESRWAAAHGPARSDEKGNDLTPEKKDIAPATPPPEPPPEPEPEPEPEKTPEPAKADPAKKQAVSAPKALRMQLDQKEAELKAASAKLTELEAKYKEAEEKGKSTTALAERLAAAEKERDEARASLRAAKQETSPEFKEKYDKPFEEAADLAREEINQLMVINPETEEPVRKADWQKDFAAIYNLERPEARVAANRLFGKEADLVMGHYTDLHRLDTIRRRALESERAAWAERTKADEAAQARNREGWQAGIKQATEYLAKSQPQYFGEDPKDPEGSKLIKDGLAFVQAKPETFKDAVIHRAAVMMYAAAHPRLKASVERLTAENAELKKTIEELKSAGPGPTRRPAGATPAPEKDWRSDLRESQA